MTSELLIAEFRDSIAPQLAPELLAVPFYVLMQPAGLPAPQSTSAYAVRGRNLMLRDYLKDIGQWRGWGPAIVFIDECENRTEFLGLATHELGHLLPAFAPTNDVEPSPAERQRQESLVLAWAAVDADPMKQVEPWAGHGIRFVRRLLHLHYRLLWLGAPLPLAALSCAGKYYGLSAPWRYLSALASEPFDLSAKSFAEIQSTPAPVAFCELFANDVAAWHKTKVEQCPGNV